MLSRFDSLIGQPWLTSSSTVLTGSKSSCTTVSFSWEPCGSEEVPARRLTAGQSGVERSGALTRLSVVLTRWRSISSAASIDGPGGRWTPRSRVARRWDSVRGMRALSIDITAAAPSRVPSPTLGRRLRSGAGVVLPLVATVWLGGCSSSPATIVAGAQTQPASSAPDTPAADQGVASGPGPQSPYQVQPQPAAGTCHYRYEGAYPLPDPRCTPGAINPKVTQATIASTICRAGYTASIRPPADITAREKAANARSYRYTGPSATGEYDHLISLEIGGDPDDPRNLWVEPNDRPGATSTNNSKDAVENAAHTAVCTGKLTLTDAQVGITTDWPALGRGLGVHLAAAG
jgi:hypothetical protein